VPGARHLQIKSESPRSDSSISSSFVCIENGQKADLVAGSLDCSVSRIRSLQGQPQSRTTQFSSFVVRSDHKRRPWKSVRTPKGGYHPARMENKIGWLKRVRPPRSLSRRFPLEGHFCPFRKFLCANLTQRTTIWLVGKNQTPSHLPLSPLWSKCAC
jgi:hypothetical protein